MKARICNPRFDAFPFPAEAMGNPAAHYGSSVQDVYLSLTQHENFEVLEIPEDVFGLNHVADWVGQVLNGGTSQYYCNVFTNNIKDIEYLKYVVESTLRYLIKIDNKPMIEAYIETLCEFVENAETYLRPSLKFSLHRTDRASAIDRIIYDNDDYFWEQYKNCILSLSNFTPIPIDVIYSHPSTIGSCLKAKPADISDDDSSSGDGIWQYVEDGRLNFKKLIQDRSELDYSVNLDNFCKYIRILLMSVKH